MKLIYLDIDGVLNAHQYSQGALSCLVDKGHVDLLNEVLAIGAEIVISSAWRYMILEGSMSLQGFEYMLRTHGVHCPRRVVGLTGRDPPHFPEDGAKIRSALILKDVEERKPKKWVAVDDLKLLLPRQNFVMTDGLKGLRRHDVHKMIAKLSS